MAARLSRLRAMSRRELSFRARTVLRTHAQRATSKVMRPQWTRSHIRRVLAGSAVDADLSGAIARKDWPGVQRRLQSMLRGRPSRFVLDPTLAASLRHEIVRRWPDAPAAGACRADQALGGRYDLLGYRALSFATDTADPDWHRDPVNGRTAPRTFFADVPYLEPSCGDHKIIWELNRHQHWLGFGRALWLTGDRRYRAAILDQLSSWMAANPPLTGINWASMLELAFRSMSWVWALHFLLDETEAADEQPWLVDMLVALDRQLLHVEQNLSYYFSPNTHLLGEALALYVVGQALPELASSARWVEVGRRVLLDGIAQQIGADGGHAERSMHYHRYTLEFYMLALLTAERAGDDAAAGPFREAVSRMAVFMGAVADAAGRTPLIGDDDGGMLWPLTGREPNDVRDTMALAALLLDEPALARWGTPEEAFWIAWSGYGHRLMSAGAEAGGPEAHALREAAATKMAVFPDTGYVTVRDGEGGHLVFDVGAHGYLNGGHAHADALGVTLALDRRPMLIDPGTSVYTTDPAVRDRMRSTACHNTLVLDGRSSSEPAGPFHWRTRADAALLASRGNNGFAWAEGTHGGYAGAQHRRNVVHVSGSGWLFVDEVLGGGRHAADLHWHFDPRWLVTCEGHRLRARHVDGTTAWMVSDGGSLFLVQGDEESGLGWCAPVYGTRVPTWSARVSRTGDAPFAMITWFGLAGDDTIPRMQRLRADCDAGSDAVAVRVRQRDVTSVMLLRPGEPPVRDARACGVADYHTNARLLHYSMRDERLISLAAADATHILALRDGLLSIAADDPIADLYVAIDGDRLDAWCSTPPSRLHVQGGGVAAIRRLRLNGRDIAPAGSGRPDTLVITSAQWYELETRADVCVA